MRNINVSVLGVQLAGLVLSPVLIHAPLVAQTWIQVSSAGPPVRWHHAMAFDDQRGKTVLFGGRGAASMLGDTWEWDGGVWTQVSTGGPSARRRHTMAYDSLRGKTVLFGGLDSVVGDLGDTWEWDGASWAQVASTGPLPRIRHAMAYDSQRARTVLYGGTSNGAVYNGTWEWDGSSWTQVPIVPPAVSPGVVVNHVMAYDILRGRTVLFGGSDLNGWSVADTWEWDGTSWTQVASIGPLPRIRHAMAYDSHRGRTVLFGGYNGGPLGDTWEWDGTNWVQVPGIGPAGRYQHAMAFDSQRGHTVLFGGEPFITGDTWELWGTSAFFSNYGVGCPGSVFTVSPCGERNPAGGTLVGTLSPLEFGILVSAGSIHVESFDIFTQSTGGNQVVLAHIYPLMSGTPLASTTITVGPTPGFYTATFPTPVQVSGSVFIAIDVSSQNVVVPTLTAGSTGTVFSRRPVTGSWAYSGSTNRPAWRIDCVEGTQYFTPSLGNVGDPIIGTTYDITLSDALPQTGAIIMTGLSDAMFSNIPLPLPLPNAPGCELLAAADATLFVFTSAAGTATYSLAVPNSTSYIGVELFHQWAVLDAVNPLGIIVSDAGRAWLGT